MADDSTFGGGLDFGTVSGAPLQGGVSDVGAGVSGTDVLPTNAQPAQGQGVPGAPAFGSGLSLSPAPAPADPLDIASNQLTQRIQRAEKATTGPAGVILNLFDPEATAHNRQLIQQGTEALVKINQQKATVAANKQQAETLGLEPGAVSPYASGGERVEAAKARALKGDLKVFQGLQMVDPQTAAAIAPQVHEVMASHLGNAQYAFDKLSNMTNQGEYSAALKELREKGVTGDIEALGFKVPETYGDFNKSKAQEGKALREARISMDTLRSQLEDRNTYQPMEKKEAETYGSRLTTAIGGLPIDNGTWSRNAASNTRGFVVNGAADPRDLGKSFTLVKPETMKPVQEQFKEAVSKEDLEKNRAFARTYKLAEPTEEQKKKGSVLNDNPNVQQGIAEGLASMLRGGQGGANVGLLKIETSKRGALQNAIDAFQSNWGAAWNTIEGKDANAYLSKLTKGQQRQVLDGLKAYNDAAMADRAGPLFEAAGAAGYDGRLFGLSKDETAGSLDTALQRGHDAQVARMSQSHQAIGGGDGVLQLGAQRPGAGATDLPPGTGNNNQLPGAPAVRTPVQQAQQPQATPPAAPSPPGGPAPAATSTNGAVSAGGAPNPPAPALQPGTAVPPPGQSGPGAGGPNPSQPQDPVHFAMDGVQGAVSQWLTDTGASPAKAQATTAKVAANPRVEKELEDTGKVSGKTVAAALGKGGDKTLVAKFTDFMNAHFMQGIQAGPDRNKAAGAVYDAAVEHAPAIGGTVGGLTGGIVGGAAGGAAGQSLKDYLQGRTQDPKAIAKEGALGGILGVASEARPVIAAGARMLGVGGVEGGAKAAEGGTAQESAEAALKGAGLAAGGEAFGRSLGMVGHKLWNLFAPSAKAEVAGAAKTLTEAKTVLETAEPKIAGATGVIDNPAYIKAEADLAKAETTIKDAGLKPDEVEYAYNVARDKVPTNEATVGRPGAAESAEVSRGYDQLRADVDASGVGKVKPTPKLADGPRAAVENKQVSAKHAELAERTEAAITAPAKDWGQKWQQLTEARSDLLKAERDAASSTQSGRTQEAKDMRTLADTVRAQQAKAAEHVFGKEQGEAFMNRLEVLDRRYATLMNATNGGDVMAAARLTGQKGRDAEKAFNAFAHDDPAAQAAYKALRRKGSDVEKDVRTGVLAEKIPVLGHVVSAVKLATTFREWMAAKAAGKPAQFSAMLGLDNAARGAARQARDIGAKMTTQDTVDNPQSSLPGSALQASFGMMQ